MKEEASSSNIYLRFIDLLIPLQLQRFGLNNDVTIVRLSTTITFANLHKLYVNSLFLNGLFFNFQK